MPTTELRAGVGGDAPDHRSRALRTPVALFRIRGPATSPVDVASSELQPSAISSRQVEPSLTADPLIDSTLSRKYVHLVLSRWRSRADRPLQLYVHHMIHHRHRQVLPVFMKLSHALRWGTLHKPPGARPFLPWSRCDVPVMTEHVKLGASMSDSPSALRRCCRLSPVRFRLRSSGRDPAPGRGSEAQPASIKAALYVALA